MRKLTLLLLILVSCCYSSLSQKLNVDSLITELGKAREDTSKVILYRILAGTLRLTDPTRALIYGKAGAALGKKIDFNKDKKPPGRPVVNSAS